MQPQAIVRSTTSDRLLSLARMTAGALFIAICSQISIPLPFTPIPLTLQTFAFLPVGYALLSREATGSAMIYLLLAMMGLPVLAGGASGLALLGPSGGYLIGMVGQAYLAGKAAERDRINPSPFRLFLEFFLASKVTLLLGTLYLSTFVGWPAAFTQGFLPFMVGDALKVFGAVLLIGKVRALSSGFSLRR